MYAVMPNLISAKCLTTCTSHLKIYPIMYIHTNVPRQYLTLNLSSPKTVP